MKKKDYCSLTKKKRKKKRWSLARNELKFNITEKKEKVILISLVCIVRMLMITNLQRLPTSEITTGNNRILT